MTKSQTFYYVAAIALIIFFTYLYTSIVEAPHYTTQTEEVETDTAPVTPEEPETEGTTLSEAATPTPTPQSPSFENESESSVHPLYSSSWEWQYTESSSGARVVPKKSGAFILSFIDAGRMSSKTDCNSLGGEYKVADEALIFGEMMTTLMFCENSDEAIYAAQLRDVEAYELRSEELYLQLSTGERMVFVLVN